MDAQRVGKFIQERRKALGLTQGALGEKLNVTDKAISRWERGVGFPDIQIVEALADALEVTVLELMRGERMEEKSIPVEAADTALTDALTLAKRKRQNTLRLLLCVGCLVLYLAVANLRSTPQESGVVWLYYLDKTVFLANVGVLLYASGREAECDVA